MALVLMILGGTLAHVSQDTLELIARVKSMSAIQTRVEMVDNVLIRSIHLHANVLQVNLYLCPVSAILFVNDSLLVTRLMLAHTTHLNACNPNTP